MKFSADLNVSVKNGGRIKVYNSIDHAYHPSSFSHDDISSITQPKGLNFLSETEAIEYFSNTKFGIEIHKLMFFVVLKGTTAI